MELVTIHPGLFLLPGASQGRYPFSHSILVDSDIVCLIDAGCGMGALEQVLEVATPDLIVLSHAHPDHASGCWMFEDVPLHVPVMSLQDVGDVDRMAERFAPPPLRPIYKAFIQGSMGFEGFQPSHTYDAGTAFDFGKARLVAVHAPGHTNDHMCFFDTATGILLATDVDLTAFGPFYGDPEADIQTFEQSIRSLMDLEPRIVVTSHGGVFREGIQERFDRFLAVIQIRHGAIAELIRTERSLDELVSLSPIYRGAAPAPADLVAMWEREMIHKHLDLLILEGRARQTERGFLARR